MTHGRKPRRPRPVNANTIGAALRLATRLTPAELKHTMSATRQCERHLREGVATEEHHTILYTVLQLALGVEATGIVRGLRSQLSTATAAMDSIRDRATSSGTWRATEPHEREMDAIAEAIDLHEYQLTQISVGELHAVAQKLQARTLSTGGAVERRSLAELGIVEGEPA